MRTHEPCVPTLWMIFTEFALLFCEKCFMDDIDCRAAFYIELTLFYIMVSVLWHTSLTTYYLRLVTIGFHFSI